MPEMDFSQRLDALETRMLHLEALLGMPGFSPVVGPVANAAAQQPTVDPPLEYAEPLEPVIELQSVSEPPPLPVMPYRQQAAMELARPQGLEQIIGLKWAGWVGAVVLVFGAALGIKFAYDQGWFLAISPVLRVCSMALIGLSLIAAGEWVYRRVNVLSATGLFGAGVAVLFVVSYSGFAYYHLYLHNTAFVFMGVSTLIGAAIARRGNLVSIAVLALIGGNLAPVLLQTQMPLLSGLLIYLLMLQGVSLALAQWGGDPKWWILRGLSLASTSLWMAAVIELQPRWLLIGFAVLFAALFQIELLSSAIRVKPMLNRAGSTFSLLVTASLVAALLYLLQDQSQAVRLSSVLALAVISGTAAHLCSRLLLGSVAMQELSTGYAIQTAALIAVAVPVAFSGVWIAAAWGVLAIAMVLSGFWLDIPVARYAAPAIWLLALVELSQNSVSTGTARHPMITYWLCGVEFSQATVIGLLLALIGQFLAKMLTLTRSTSADKVESRSSHSGGQLPLALSISATFVWLTASLTGLADFPATASILSLCVLLDLLDRWDQHLNYLLQAATVTGMVIWKWALIDLLAPRLSGSSLAQPLILSLRGFTSMLVLISVGMLYHRAASTTALNRYSQTIKKFSFAAAIAVFLWLGSFDIDQLFINLRSSSVLLIADPDRAEQVALSIFWSVFALACIAGGFGWRMRGLRYVGLALFALTLLKVVTLDLSQVSTGYRVVSFLGLGALLLLTSVIYGKLSPILLSTFEKEPHTP